MPKTLISLTGSGISAKSGIKTFCDSGGLWEEHRVEDVASIEGWYRNPKLVLEFYNRLRAGGFCTDGLSHLCDRSERCESVTSEGLCGDTGECGGRGSAVKETVEC